MIRHYVKLAVWFYGCVCACVSVCVSVCVSCVRVPAPDEVIWFDYTNIQPTQSLEV